MNAPHDLQGVLSRLSDPTSTQPVTITLAGDGTLITGCRPDLLNVADLDGRGWSIIPLSRSKIPAARWEPYQRRLATLDD